MENINIEKFEELMNPSLLHKSVHASNEIIDFVKNTRITIRNIINGDSDKKLFIVGPCSIHNVTEALEYGKRLKKIANKVKDKILIVMRVYFEKPRTTVGWKGLINDPDLDNSFDVNKGLILARQLLLNLNTIGIPCAYEVLDTITPQYISDLISWGAIGARTTESQVHRQLVSGLSMPVGFKNGTGGNIKIARDAILSARYAHCFMGITNTGEPAICKTKGNLSCHLILRGSSDAPNYSEQHIEKSIKLLDEHKLPRAIMVDCSHGNSRKDHTKQKVVLKNIMNQIKANKHIIGVMIESNIYEGHQKLTDPAALAFGVSITDSCINIIETESIILDAYNDLKKKLKSLKGLL